jgi:hypothetical protein
MARDRFRDIEQVFSELATANIDINQLPANSKFRKYYEWKTNPEQRETGSRDAGSLPGESETVYVKPFGFDYDANTGYKTTISNRSLTRANTIGASTFDYATTAPTTVQTLSNFIPAKAVLSLKLGSPGTVRRSKITGKPYKPRTSATYTIPFGRGTSTESEFSKQDSFAAARRFYLKQINILRFQRLATNWTLVLRVPYWFRHIDLTVWQYTGLIEDTTETQLDQIQADLDIVADKIDTLLFTARRRIDL